MQRTMWLRCSFGLLTMTTGCPDSGSPQHMVPADSAATVDETTSASTTMPSEQTTVEPTTTDPSTAGPTTVGPTTDGTATETATTTETTTTGTTTDGTTEPVSTTDASTTDGTTTGGTTEPESTTDVSTTTTTDGTTEPASTTDASTTTTTDGTTDASTTGPEPICGNGTLEQGESCDDGDADETDACTTLCKPPACDDGLKSGDESDTDCGGSCDGCGLGQPCTGDGDCASGSCAANLCVEPCMPWSRQWGSIYTDAGRAIAADGADNIFVAGHIENGHRGTVRKLSASGAELWTQMIDTQGDDLAIGVATDSAGHVLVTGVTHGNLDGNVSLGSSDAILVKYDTSGTRLWTRQFGSAGGDTGAAVATDAAGNAIVAGSTNGTTDGQVPVGGRDIFVAKFDASGVKQWSRLLGSSGDDVAYNIATDGDGNILVVGETNGSFDGNTWLGEGDGFVAKFDAGGTKQWVHQIGAEYTDDAGGVAADAAGNVYVTGTVQGNLDGNPWAGSGDVFLTKYDPNGAKQWTRQYGSDDHDGGRDIAIDGAGNLLVSGWTDGPLDGNPAKGGFDLFVTKFDPAGVKQWTRVIGTIEHEMGGHVAVLSTGMPVLLGDTEGKFAPPVVGGPDIIAAHLCTP
ncbi:SBBP repeat-containing protein [Nannocystis radixulma]|uniref:SBBP repeat-containing protein n=1 Tax=Nannocystis radixulma TaxID=2995305 RepID=A0ABT5BJ25_9BACT|nr:SBBP repeat-containing protein [Nannocystis radixulma]MDC0673403.1 SBBP repeat-containing protein [Nannocystis radixulma]